MNPSTRSLRYFFLIALGVAGLSALPARAWWNPDYTLRKKITIDTTAAGGGIQDPIGTTPVLIRLSGDFNFSAAKDDGSDLRLIAGDDKTPLAFHIEKFDSLLALLRRQPARQGGARRGRRQGDLRQRHGGGLSFRGGGKSPA
jgi:hypothetical protein